MKEKKIETIEDGKVKESYIKIPMLYVDEVPNPVHLLSCYAEFEKSKQVFLEDENEKTAEKFASQNCNFNLKLKVVDGRADHHLKPVRKQPYSKHEPMDFTTSTPEKLECGVAKERITDSLQKLKPMKENKKKKRMLTKNTPVKNGMLCLMRSLRMQSILLGKRR